MTRDDAFYWAAFLLGDAMRALSAKLGEPLSLDDGLAIPPT